MASETGPDATSESDGGHSIGRAGGIAGASLLLMAIISFISLPLIEGFAVPGDALATASNIADNETQFRLATAGLLVVVVLDVVIAWALYVFLEPVNQRLSMLAMVFRLVYAAILGAALSNLLSIAGLLDGGTAVGAFHADQVAALVALNYSAFAFEWDVALAISGVHLLLVGYLVIESEYVPNVVGALLLIAALGYAIDHVAVILIEGYSLAIIQFTFVGEVVFLGWLLYRGRMVDRPEQATIGA